MSRSVPRIALLICAMSVLAGNAIAGPPKTSARKGQITTTAKTATTAPKPTTPTPTPTTRIPWSSGAARHWKPVAPATVREPRPFTPTGFWNGRIPADQAADPGSATLVNELVRQVGAFGPWINTTAYTQPVYTVGPDQPLVSVTLNKLTSPLKDEFAKGVPLPDNAWPSAGTDASLIVWQPSSNTIWEFWQLHHDQNDGGRWHATWGGVMRNVSANPGASPQGYGTAASGLALLGGMIRPGEFASWDIGHALKLGVPEVSPVIRAPANRTDGKFAGGIPMGTRFQLDPNLDVWSLNVPLATKIIAYAAQRHGLVVGDSSGAVNLYAEDPLTMTSNPWPSLLGGSPGEVMRQFPWSRLRALPPLAG